MQHQDVTEIHPGNAPVRTLDNAGTALPRLQKPTPLRYAVSLTDPQGKEIFRKQFASCGEADSFARATAELCPEYKVSSVDRIDGFAYEVMGQSLTITASGRKDTNSGTPEGEHTPS
jgi:hypothetical protein